MRTTITFLEEAEVLICGSTLFACNLAVEAARAGKRTVLAMERTNPFYEGIPCLRSWLDEGDASETTPLLGAVLTDRGTSVRANGRVYFNPTRAALDIEDALCEAGVRFYYNATPAAALSDGKRLRGVGFAGKPGLFAVESPLLIDATPNATVARAAGGEFSSLPGPRRASYVVEMSAPAEPSHASFHASNGSRCLVEVHHYYACFDVVLPEPAAGPFAHAKDFAQVYEAALEFSEQLPKQRFRGADAYLTSGAKALPGAEGRPSGFDNLFVYGPLTVAGNQGGSLLLRDPLALFRAFPRAGEVVRQQFEPLSRSRPTYRILNRGMEEGGRARTEGHDQLPGSRIRRTGRRRGRGPLLAAEADVALGADRGGRGNQRRGRGLSGRNAGSEDVVCRSGRGSRRNEHRGRGNEPVLR